MKYYELTYLLIPELLDSEVQDIQQKINASIQKKEGILDIFGNPRRIRLSHPIKKRMEAYISSICFYLKKEDLDEFKKEMGAEANILRFVLSNKRKMKVVKAKERTLEKKPKEKTELKDIDQKLEEILD